MAKQEEHLQVTREGSEWVVSLASRDNWQRAVFGRFEKQPMEK